MILELESGKWRAAIAPGKGGNMACLRYDGEDVLAPMTPDNADSCLAGSPMLLPANRTTGGRFCFAGRVWRLPVNEPKSGAHLHGLLRTAAFSAEERSAASVRLVYENRGEIYPFPFRMEVVYALSEGGLAAHYALTNLSEEAMPYSFGLHTAFVEPARFSAPLGMQQERDEKNLPTGRYLPLNDEEKAYVRGTHSRRRIISGYYTAAGDTARIGDYIYRAEGFDHWILYNARGEGGVLCVEPQRGCVDALNRPDCPLLAGHETVHFGTYLSHAE